MNVFARLAGFVVVSVWGCSLQAQPAPCPLHPSHISVESGSFSSQPGVTFVLHHFVATLVPMGKEAPLCFQKFTVVSHAEIFVSNDSLTQVFAEKLGATDSKIKDLKIQNSADKVTLTGKLSQVIPTSFQIAGPVTTDGVSLLVDAKEIKTDGVPIKGLLGLVGEHLSALMSFKGMNGVSIKENTLSFSPERIAHLKGYISGVETSPAGLTLRYGRKPAVHLSRLSH